VSRAPVRRQGVKVWIYDFRHWRGKSRRRSCHARSINRCRGTRQRVPVTEENASRDCKLSIFAAHPVRSVWRLGGLNSREPTARKRKQQLRRRPPIRRQEAAQRSSQFQESHNSFTPKFVL